LKELIKPCLFINLFIFIVGTMLGLDYRLMVISMPGGYVYQINTNFIIFSVLAAVIALSFIGVKVLGSGLSDTTVSIINRCVIYFMTWAILSTMSLSFLQLIPTFGNIIYMALTFVYAFGVFYSCAEIGGVGGGTPSPEGRGGSE